MFLQLPITTLLISVVAFLVFALPWTLLAWLDPEWAKPAKIQQKPFQVRRYFLPNLGRITVNSLIMLGLQFLIWPLLRLSGIHDGPIPPWWVFVVQIAFFIVLDDFLFYWMHRMLHQNRWLMKHVHSVHHRIHNTCALDGNYFHWLEFVMIGGLALVGPILVGAHLYVVYAWIIIRQFEAADGHCGYDFKWSPAHLIPGYEGAPYHDFHHARFKGNYAGFMPWVDRLYGTYIKQYLAYRANKLEKEAEATLHWNDRP